jgi:hypothetical protein
MFICSFIRSFIHSIIFFSVPRHEGSMTKVRHHNAEACIRSFVVTKVIVRLFCMTEVNNRSFSMTKVNIRSFIVSMTEVRHDNAGSCKCLGVSSFVMTVVSIRSFVKLSWQKSALVRSFVRSFVRHDRSQRLFRFFLLSVETRGIHDRSQVWQCRSMFSLLIADHRSARKRIGSNKQSEIDWSL